jgi:threonine synthase
MNLTSANSINIGRLLPQVMYYAYTSCNYYYQHGIWPSFIIPTGNLGNATAAYWAKAMNFPIDEITLATNANKVISDYLSSGVYTPQPSQLTLANAMDVGNPSNLERLQKLFQSFEIFKRNVTAISADDDSIRKTIKKVYDQYQLIICPHTATAFFASQKLPKKHRIVIATAHPCKFEQIIEPIIKHQLELPTQLASILNKENYVWEVPPDMQKIKATVADFFGV